MKKIFLAWLMLFSSYAFAVENGGPAFIYDSAGNALTSTTGALNVSFGASTFAVTQSTTPWVTKDLSDGSVTGGTAGTFSLLGGGIFNTSLPTLTNGQQASFQFDSSARLFTASTQSGIWTVEPGNTPNTSPWLFTINQGGNSATVSAGGALKVDGSGATQPVSGTVTAIPTDGTKSAYSVVIVGVTPASTATDVFTIIGSGSKIVRIRNMMVYGAQTTGSIVPVNIIKRSTANTGGTSTTGTAVPWSSANAAATAVVSAYTVNPSALGTSLGLLSYETPFIPILQDTLFQYDFSLVPYQTYTLNTAAETIAINLNGATVTGGSLAFKISWTEE